MINKIYISDFEKENILNQHKRINESTGTLSLGGFVLNDLSVGISGCLVSLIKDNKIVITQNTIADGSFKFENLDEYDIVIKDTNLCIRRGYKFIQKYMMQPEVLKKEGFAPVKY